VRTIFRVMKPNSTARAIRSSAGLVASGIAGYFAFGAILGVAGRTPGTLQAGATVPALPPLVGDPAKSVLVRDWEKLRVQHGHAAGDFPALYAAARSVPRPFLTPFLLSGFACTTTPLDFRLTHPHG
jgi:hypothetical protein